MICQCDTERYRTCSIVYSWGRVSEKGPNCFQNCSVISFGHNSANNSYSLGGVLLNTVSDVCDLGNEFKTSLGH